MRTYIYFKPNSKEIKQSKWNAKLNHPHVLVSFASTCRRRFSHRTFSKEDRNLQSHLCEHYLLQRKETLKMMWLVIGTWSTSKIKFIQWGTWTETRGYLCLRKHQWKSLELQCLRCHSRRVRTISQNLPDSG